MKHTFKTAALALGVAALFGSTAVGFADSTDSSSTTSETTTTAPAPVAVYPAPIVVAPPPAIVVAAPAPVVVAEPASRRPRPANIARRRRATTRPVAARVSIARATAPATTKQLFRLRSGRPDRCELASRRRLPLLYYRPGCMARGGTGKIFGPYDWRIGVRALDRLRLCVRLQSLAHRDWRRADSVRVYMAVMIRRGISMKVTDWTTLIFFVIASVMTIGLRSKAFTVYSAVSYGHASRELRGDRSQ